MGPGAMRTIAIMNQKGGSGKTTCAVNLGAALGEAGKRVLVVDLDPQASASSWLGAEDGGQGLLEVFTQGRALSELVQPTSAPGVDVIPASSWLVGVDRALAGEVGAETLFGQALSRLPRRWDVVLVDCPPSLGLLSVSALCGCREVLVPVAAQVLALSGLASLVKTVAAVQQRLNARLKITAILACRVDRRTNLSKEVVQRLRGRFKKQVLKSEIRENVRLAEAPSFHEPITQYAPRSHGAEDFRSAAAELLSKRRKR